MPAFDRSRRRSLIALAALGLPSRGAVAQSPPQLRGQVFVNGRPADPDTRLALGDEVLTGPDSQAIFVIGRVRTGARLEVRAMNHAPHSIHAEIASGRTIRSAEIKSHSNVELAALEALAGRTSPLDPN